MGPRALGNRSILCDPSIDGMKDTLNAKVKFREHFRPFAPIVRLEDYREYFDCRCESPYMSFAARVRPEYRTKLKEIVHVDGTARLQTVRRETNPTIWELLKIYKQDHGLGVLLNTSFNHKGQADTYHLEDAFDVLKNTLLDYVFDGEFLLLDREDRTMLSKRPLLKKRWYDEPSNTWTTTGD
jgi:carbamoyltransferase